MAGRRGTSTSRSRRKLWLTTCSSRWPSCPRYVTFSTNAARSSSTGHRAPERPTSPASWQLISSVPSKSSSSSSTRRTRTRTSSSGTDPHQERPRAPQRLADEWRTSAAVPSGVASLLETSRARSPTAGSSTCSWPCRGRISREWAERLDAARQLRNGFAHADGQRLFTVGMAAPLLAAAHEVYGLLAS